MSVTVILGLRRSGTTIFWEWFRQDQRFTCFDEPHSEQLMKLPRDISKHVFGEYRALVERSPAEFWATYAPIHRAEELDPFFAPRQAAYLRYLADQGTDVVFDLTRCHLKVAELAELLPDARFLHLVRDERAFASSHLLPSRTDLRGRMQKVYLERTFWTRSDRFDFWGMEALCGTAPGSKVSLLLAAAGFDVAGFYGLPAVGRLLVLHRLLTAEAERALAETGRSALVRFEDFTRDAPGTVERACRELGVVGPAVSGAAPPREASPGYRPDDARWADVVRRVDAVCPKQAVA